MREVETHEGVAGFKQSLHHSHVGLCARVGLHVGEGGVEQLAGAVDGDLLALVDDLAAAVVTLAGITLGVFVGHDRTHGLQNLLTDKVLRSDKFNSVHLTLFLLANQIKDFFVSFHECVFKI